MHSNLEIKRLIYCICEFAVLCENIISCLSETYCTEEFTRRRKSREIIPLKLEKDNSSFPSLRIDISILLISSKEIVIHPPVLNIRRIQWRSVEYYRCWEGKATSRLPRKHQKTSSGESVTNCSDKDVSSADQYELL
jgi:hypothetical protein